MSAGKSWFEEAFDAPYLEVYAHRDAAEAELATESLISPVGIAGRRVLDLACGGGRYVTTLHRRHARVVGLDLSMPLLRSAQEHMRSHRNPLGLVRGNMLRLPFSTSRFDIVLSMFTSFGYFSSPREDLAVLAEVHRVLQREGHLFIDLFNAERVRSNLVSETRRLAGRFEVHETRRLNAQREVVIKDIELRDGDAIHRYREEVRLWEADVLEAALAESGFAVEERWGSYSGAAYDAVRSERLIVRAQPRGHA